jgi:hypothetical protein
MQVSKAHPLMPILGAQKHIALPINRHLISRIETGPHGVDSRLIAGRHGAGAIGQLQTEAVRRAVPPIPKQVGVTIGKLKHRMHSGDLMRAVVKTDHEERQARSRKAPDNKWGQMIAVSDNLNPQSRKAFHNLHQPWVQHGLAETAQHDSALITYLAQLPADLLRKRERHMQRLIWVKLGIDTRAKGARLRAARRAIAKLRYVQI